MTDERNHSMESEFIKNYGAENEFNLLPCPFCGSNPRRYINNDILHVECSQCVSVGFHNHIRLGCYADSEWNKRS